MDIFGNRQYVGVPPPGWDPVSPWLRAKYISIYSHLLILLTTPALRWISCPTPHVCNATPSQAFTPQIYFTCVLCQTPFLLWLVVGLSNCVQSHFGLGPVITPLGNPKKRGLITHLRFGLAHTFWCIMLRIMIQNHIIRSTSMDVLFSLYCEKRDHNTKIYPSPFISTHTQTHTHKTTMVIPYICYINRKLGTYYEWVRKALGAILPPSSLQSYIIVLVIHFHEKDYFKRKL